MECLDNLPEVEICEDMGCPHIDYISGLELQSRLGATSAIESAKRIADERKNHCRDCRATRYRLYLKARGL